MLSANSNRLLALPEMMLCSLVAVLLQILHERRAARPYCMRIFRVGWSLPEHVRYRVFKVEGAETLEPGNTRVVDLRQLRSSGILEELPHRAPVLEGLDERTLIR